MDPAEAALIERIRGIRRRHFGAGGKAEFARRLVLYRVRGEASARCRVWLGARGGAVHLGRASDGGHESVARDDLLWSVGVLFRVARAA